MFIYLDNAASTPVNKRVLDCIMDTLPNYYANPESQHQAGYSVRKLLHENESELVSAVTGKSDLPVNVFWTGSGTEAIQHALSIPGNLKGNILTTPIEHPALSEGIVAQMSSGTTDERKCSVYKIRVLKDGLIDLESLRQRLDEDVTLVAIHHIHNEIGVIQDLHLVRQMIDQYSPQARLMVDTVQSVGKFQIPFEEAGIDFMFISGHKIGVPFGGALLYRDDDGHSISEYFNNLRNNFYKIGRPDPVVTTALVEGVKHVVKKRHLLFEKISELNRFIRDELSDMTLPNRRKIVFTTPADFSSPYILNFLVPGYQGAVLVRMLSQKKIMVSTGSACQAASKEPNKTLMTIGVDRKDSFSGLRLSFWENTDRTQLEEFIIRFKEILSEY